MKNKKILILSIIVNIVFLLIICFFISGYKNIIKERQVIKEMTTSTLEENLNAQITQLNKSHTDYANSIEESKKKIASAITEKGVATSNEETLDTMANNIRSIASESKLTLLWENEDITSQTSQITIPLELNDYTGILVAFKGNMSFDYRTYFYIPKGITRACYVDVNASSPSTTGGALWKMVTPSDNGIEFGTTMGGTLYPSLVIPMEIYGVKAEIV